MTPVKVYPTKLYMRFMGRLAFYLFTRWHGIKGKVPREVKNLKSPYLLLGNHAGFWDPFVVGYFLPRFTHFVSSDAAFRSPFFRFFLTRLGTIPKKKNIRDTKVIRDIAAVIRQGENVGLFPEAVRNWAGETQKMDKSIAKLVRMLKVPVIIAVMKGMNLFHPRWSRKIRRTKLEIDYKLLFENVNFESISEDEIFDELNKAMYHNEIELQRHRMSKIHSKCKAEFINHTLYVCPECLAIDSFAVRGDNFNCRACGYDIHINDYGFFERISPGTLHFDNILDWFKWEEKWMIGFIYDKIDREFKGLILEDKGSAIYFSDTDSDLESIGTADLKLFIDRIEICFTSKEETLILNFKDLQTINPQVNEKLEIFYNNKAYRAIGAYDGVSALKWEVAVNAIWKRLGMDFKLSPYINI